MNYVEKIKNEFESVYVDKGPENGILQGYKYAGSATHCRNCLYTITKIIKPKKVLEVGSWKYESSDAIGNAMVEMYDELGDIVINSLDIATGGFSGGDHKPKHDFTHGDYWYPHHTTYDEWKYTDEHIVFKEFKEMSNEEIFDKNVEILDKITPFGTYDLIFLDGDHAYEGVKFDWEYALKYSHKDTVIVFDNIWDIRLHGVKKFFDDLTS